MAEHFRFFDAQLNDQNQPDREYNAQEFTDYFRALVTTGLMKGAGNQLKVDTSGSNMESTIDTGIAFITGKYYENDSLLSHTHDTETLGLNRIDRVVIRLDGNTDARYVKSFVKKGVASASPVAPALTQTPNVYEISLAQVKVIGGQTFINKVDVLDERGTEVICPYAGSNILPNFNAAGLDDLINTIDTHINNNTIHITAAERVKWDNTVNAVTIGGLSEDPNTTTIPMILTDSFNGPFPGEYKYIHTSWFNNRGSSKSQIAVSYTGTPRMAIRSSYQDVWQAWTHIVTPELPVWTKAVMAAGWEPIAEGGLSYYKDSFGIVHLKGQIFTRITPPSLITTMPVGFRPMSTEWGLYVGTPVGGQNIYSVSPSGFLFANSTGTGANTHINISYRTR